MSTVSEFSSPGFQESWERPNVYLGSQEIRSEVPQIHTTDITAYQNSIILICIVYLTLPGY